jgi:hypothetical protein
LVRRATVVVVGVATLAGLALPVAHADPPPDTPPTAIAINQNGYVIGVTQQEQQSMVGVWNPAGQFTYLQARPDDQSNGAFVINRHKVIAGFRRDTNYYTHPVVWNSSGQITDLSGGSLGGEARAVNDKCVVVGDVAPTGQLDVPAEWDHAGRLTLLPLPAGATYGEAWAINNRGVVLGHVAQNYPGRALLWYPDGHTVDLATPTGGQGAFPLAINDDGTSVGYAIGPSYQIYPVRWSRHGQVTVLGTDQGRANAISKDGVAVGSVINPTTGTTLAVRWNPVGRQTPLPTPIGFTMSDANGINTAGDIVGDLSTDVNVSAVEWTTDDQLVYLH